jgi:hypothetical protein
MVDRHLGGLAASLGQPCATSSQAIDKPLRFLQGRLEGGAIDHLVPAELGVETRVLGANIDDPPIADKRRLLPVELEAPIGRHPLHKGIMRSPRRLGKLEKDIPTVYISRIEQSDKKVWGYRCSVLGSTAAELLVQAICVKTRKLERPPQSAASLSFGSVANWPTGEPPSTVALIHLFPRQCGVAQQYDRQ